MRKNSTDREKKTIIWIVVITAFVTTFTGSALNLSIPDISDEFGINAGTVGWLVTGYTLAVAAMSVPMGHLADETCRETVLAAGTAIFTACCIAAVFSVSMVMLLVVRIVQGIGAAMIFSTNTAILVGSFPESRRGRVIGYSLAATYAGMSAGPAVGGFMNHHFGWRSIFILTGIICVAALIPAIFRLSGHRTGRVRCPADLIGNILYMAFIVTLMYGLSELGRGNAAVIMIIIGVMLGTIFVRHELKTEKTVIQMTIFRDNPCFTTANIAAMMNYGATFAVTYLISIYLQAVMGFTSQTAGFIMICQPVVIAALTPVAGKFSDRLSPYVMSSAGMALCAAGTCILTFIAEETGLPVIISALIVTGAGFALFSSPNTNAVMSSVDQDEYSAASSILATMRSAGNTLSMIIVTVIAGIYLPDSSLAGAELQLIVRIVNISFVAFTAVCTAGIFISLKHGVKR